jgi:hypothetical protein
MSTPATGTISIQDIQNEINKFVVSPPDTGISSLYDTVNYIGYTGALQYHNLALGTGANQPAKIIYDIRAAGSNLGMTGWYNYSQDITLKTDYYIERIGALVGTDITGNLYLANSVGTVLGTIASFTLTAGSPTAAGNAVVDGGSTTTQTIGDAGYFLYVDAAILYNPPYTGPPPPPPLGAQVSATGVDVDGVGAGTNRDGLGMTNFSDTNPLNPPTTVLGGTALTDPIAVNKRSSVTITFTG